LNISRIRSDALGNTEWSNAFNRLSFEGSQTGTQLNSDTAWNFVYRPGVGRLERQSSRSIARPYVRTDEHAYDTVGNAKFRLDNGTVTAAAYYYDALGQLRATDTRDGNGLRISSGVESYVFEEYRYDPLGRRVLVRARRGCKEISGANGNPVDCNVSLIRRTLWDGDRELYEIQMPGGDTLNAATLENDTLVVKDVLPSAKWTDVTPYYGRVSYVHGGGIDQPLGVVRINYGEVLDWVVLKPGSVEPGSRTYVAWAPFVLVPHWDPRGYAELGSFGSGGWRSCRAVQHSGGSQVCVRLEWRSGWDLVVPRLSHTGSKQSLSWHGTLLQDKRDASNLSYRRNRYVDPASGRFTQEDPIGLAGGLNLYGFANGDPVSYSDPYGLSAEKSCPMCLAAYALFEIGSTIYDAYQASSTLADQSASGADKGLALAGLAAGAFTPGPGNLYVRGGREVVEHLGSFERARNGALRTIGEIDHTNFRPVVGRLGSFRGQVVGFETRVNGVSKRMRIDWDPTKGAHINVEIGRGQNAVRRAYQFRGSLGDVLTLLRRNTPPRP
jgi:RHS repeat-associated protein